LSDQVGRKRARRLNRQAALAPDLSPREKNEQNIANTLKLPTSWRPPVVAATIGLLQASITSAYGLKAGIRTLPAADIATLQSELRHPPRKLWIHTADTVVLNKEISARNCNRFDQA